MTKNRGFTLPIIKEFDRKDYKMFDIKLRKSDALKESEQFKDEGYLVRIIEGIYKGRKAYFLYERRK